MKLRNIIALAAFSLAVTGVVWADSSCCSQGCCDKDGHGCCARKVGGGVPGEKIDFSENAVFVKSIGIYSSDVTITKDNKIVDKNGKVAQPITELKLQKSKPNVAFKIIGLDTKGKYSVLADDRHTCVGWVNNVDNSKFATIDNNSRSLRFVGVNPKVMELMVSYQTVPGSSTPIQKVLKVSCK